MNIIKRLSMRVLRHVPLALIGLAAVSVHAAGPAITVTKDDGVPAATRVPAGSKITYTHKISNGAGGTEATGVQFVDPDVAHTGYDAGSLTATPVARDDTYAPVVLANTSVNTSLSTGFNVLANDFLGYSGGLQLTAASAAVTVAVATPPAHGTVSFNSGAAKGTFVYTPTAGYTGADSFTYTLSNGVSGGTTLSVTGTVNLTVGGTVVWYVDAVNGLDTNDGTLGHPFKTLAKVSTVDAANQKIFLIGNNTATYTGGITLEAGESLVGQAALGSNFDDLLGISPGADITTARPFLNYSSSRPQITNTTTGGHAITLAEGNTIVGLSVIGASGSGIAGTNVNSGTIGNPTASDVSISGTTGAGFALNGGSGTFTVNASISTAAGYSVNISNRSGGTVTFNRPISDTGTGIRLSSNTGATFNFTAGLTLSTGDNTAFSATGGGTVNVTQDNTTIINTITTTGGAALNVANTSIGASGLTFRSISSGAGSSNGITLIATGSGAFAIVGNGTAGSGGTIQKKTGVDGNPSGGTGIYLSNTGSVSLTRMVLNDFDNFAIRGAGVNGFSLTNSSIGTSSASKWNGSNDAGGINEGSVYFTELTGTASITNTNIYGGFADNFRLVNSTGTLNRITFDTVTIGTNHNGGDGSSDRGNDGITIEANGSAIINATVNNCTFTSARGDLFQFENDGTGATDLIFTGNRLSNNYPRIVTGGGGFALGTNGTGALTYNIAGNSFRDASGAALLLTHSSAGTAAMTGTITSNTVGVAGVANSGSLNGDAIKLQLVGAAGGAGSGGTMKTTVTGNILRQYNNLGIDMMLGGGAPVIHQGTYSAIITGNIIGPLGSNTSAAQAQGIGLNGGTSDGDAFKIYLQIGGTSEDDKNTVTNWTAGNLIDDIRLRQRQSTTVYLSQKNGAGATNYTGAASDTAAVGTFLTGANTTTGHVSVTVSGSGGGFVGGAPPLMFTAGGVEKAAVIPAPAPAAKMEVTAAPAPIISTPSTQTAVLTQPTLDAIVSSALARWEATGLTSEQSERLQRMRFEISTLSADHLGEAGPDVIRVDARAGGCGWFTDASAQSDALFGRDQTTTRSYTDAASAPAGRIDLLTTILHEMGHALGLPDSYSLQDRDSIMYGYLTKGERRLPAPGQARGAVPFAGSVTHFLTNKPYHPVNNPTGADAQINPLAIGTLPPGKSVVITYSVTVETPILGGTVYQLDSQATVQSTTASFPDVTSVDYEGSTATGQAHTLTLLAVPPVITNGPPPVKGKVGTAYNFSYTATGAPTPTFTATGLPPSVSISSAGVISGAPTGAGGVYNVEVTAANGVLPNATQSYTLAIAGAPVVGTPTVSPLSNVNEGESTTYTVSGTFTDPLGNDEAPFTATVDWGDGSATSSATVTGSSNPFNYSFNGAHTYADNGSYSVKVSVTNADTLGSTSAGTSVAVVNVSPTVNAPTSFTPTLAVLNASTAFTISGTFSDPGGSDGPFTGTVNWGDTTTSALNITGTSYSFSGNHTYTSAGLKNVTISITDKDTGSNTSTPATVVTVATKPVIASSATADAITTSSAALHSDVTGDGGSPVTERGFVIAKTSENSNPQLNGVNVTKIVVSGTTGVLDGSATALSLGTGYSFAAYATNAAGTIYTSPVSTFTTLSAIVVTNANDDTNPGSLRRALTDVTADGLIIFDPTFFATARTITLTSALPAIAQNVTITGPGADKLTLDGANAYRAFVVNSGVTASISGMKITHGFYVGNIGGGAIYNRGALTLSRCVFDSNHADDGGSNTTMGGAVLCDQSGSTLTAYKCTFSNNVASGLASYGGAMAAINGGRITISNSTFYGNNLGFLDGTSSNGGGGALYVDSTSNASVSFTTMTGNYGGLDGGGAIDYYNKAGGITTLKISNSIFSGNVSDSNNDVQLINATFAAGANVNSLIGTATGVGILAGYGGALNTVALLPGSNALNAGSSITTLASAAGASDTTLTVAEASLIASTPGSYLIKIDNEQMLVTAVDLASNTLTVQRAANGSTAAAHSSAAGITFGADERDLPFFGTAPDIGSFESQGYSFTIVSGSSQSAVVNTAFANPLVALVKDGAANLPGATVTFTPPVSGASGAFTTSNSVVSNSSGLATSNTFTANTVAGGAYNVVASVSTLTSLNYSLTNTPGAAAAIAVNSGASQSATVNTAFANPLSVTVTDAFGNRVPGVSVTFTAPASGAAAVFSNSTNTITATTNASGVAAQNITANTAAGDYRVTVLASGGTNPSRTLDLTNTPGVPTQLVTTQQPSTTATAGAAFATQPTVTLKDQFGNVVTTDSTHTITAARGTHGTATLQGTPLTVTVSNGVATFSGLSYNLAEVMNLTFSTNAGAFTATSNDVAVSPAAASQLVVTTQPSTTATAGVALATQPVVKLADAFGNIVTTDSTHTVTATRGTKGSAALQGAALTVTVANGVASFSGLSYNKAETLNLAFSTNAGAFTATSNDIVVSPAAASQLLVSTQPSTTATAGVAFATQPVVSLADSFGNVVTSDSTHTVTAARGTKGTAALQGAALTVTLSNGVGTLSGLSYNKAETMNLAFSTNAGAFTATSNDIVVSAAAGSQLAVTTQPSTTATAGVAFSTQPVVTLKDQYGNTVTSDSTHTVTAARGTHGTAALQGTPLTVTLSSGVATLSGLSYNKAETMNLSFSTNAGAFTTTSNDVVVSPAAAASLALSAASTANAGAPLSLTVTAVDAFSNTATGYRGIVGFTSTDANALLPASYTFTAGDNGAHTFSNSVTFENNGSFTVTGTDSSISGTSNAVVVSETVTLAASDANAAVTGGDTGAYRFTRGGNGAALTVNFTLNGASSAITAEYSLSNGSVSFNGSTGTAVIPAGATSVDVTLTASANATGIAKPAKTAQLDLATGSTYTTGTPATGSVTIAQNGFGVFNANDSGQGSLRQALLNANALAGDDVILFDATTFGGSITLTSPLAITSNVNLTAPAGLIVRAASTATNVFNVTAGTVTFRNLTIRDGAVGVSSSSVSIVTVINSAIIGNASSGISNAAGNVTVINTTFSGNGTGILLPTSGSVNVYNCTLSGNTTGVAGGVGVTLFNTLCVGNTTNTSGAFTNGGGNLTTGTAAAAGLDSNGLQNNGGPTLTIALLGGSAALNAGINANIPADTFDLDGDNNLVESLPVDQRGVGFPRVQGSTVDIGAVEALIYTPTLTDATTSEDLQTTSGLVITANTADAGGTTHYQITGITNGTLFQHDGTTAIANGDFITKAQGTAGLKFTPAADLFSPATATFGFSVQASISADDTGLKDRVVAATVTVNPVADTPSVTNSTTTQNIQSLTGLVLSRNAVDGSEIGFFKISNVLNGTVYLNNGTTAVSAGDFISFAQGNAGLKFTPTLNFTGIATFDVQGSVDSSGTGLSSVATASIAVGTVDPTPAQSVPIDPVTGQPLPPGSPYPTISQTGLLEMRVNVKNTTALPINGFKLSVDYNAYVAANPTLRLYNSSSAPSVVPAFINYPYPVAVGDTVVVKLEFYSATRRLPDQFAPTLAVTNLAASQVSTTDGTGVQPRIKLRTDGNVLLEWDSTPGQWYRIKYSSDMTNWYDSTVPIQAVTTRTQWIDDGAPFTNVPPNTVPKRFYRLNEIAAPVP